MVFRLMVIKIDEIESDDGSGSAINYKYYLSGEDPDDSHFTSTGEVVFATDTGWRVGDVIEIS